MSNEVAMTTANAVERLKQQICARCSELVVTAGAQELQVLANIVRTLDMPDFARAMGAALYGARSD